MEEKVYTSISGHRMAVLREKKGLTQKDFAEMIGISRPTVVTWEAKDRIKLKEDQLKLVLKALDCSVKDLTKDASFKDDEGDILDHPLVKSYVDQISQLNKLVEVLERENARLRGGK